MMPCYNANATLPRALASLLAQTYGDWECIVVDDGSVESPARITEVANDPRIKHVAFAENRGRAAARQAALDHARGEYLAMLDADDWMFPNRLEDQLAVLANSPELVLVSSAVAIVNRTNDIIGVRGGADGRQAMQWKDPAGLVRPSFVHAPSMIRMSIAKQYSYNLSLTTTEDLDFILKLIIERRYGLLGKIHYAYAEDTTLTREKILTSYRHGRDIFRRYLRRYPVASSQLLLSSYMKSGIYRLAFHKGAEGKLISRRSFAPSKQDEIDFLCARTIVESVNQRVFAESGIRLATGAKA